MTKEYFSANCAHKCVEKIWPKPNYDKRQQQQDSTTTTTTSNGLDQKQIMINNKTRYKKYSRKWNYLLFTVGSSTTNAASLITANISSCFSCNLSIWNFIARLYSRSLSSSLRNKGKTSFKNRFGVVNAIKNFLLVVVVVTKDYCIIEWFQKHVFHSALNNNNNKIIDKKCVLTSFVSCLANSCLNRIISSTLIFRV